MTKIYYNAHIIEDTHKEILCGAIIVKDDIIQGLLINNNISKFEAEKIDLEKKMVIPSFISDPSLTSINKEMSLASLLKLVRDDKILNFNPLDYDPKELEFLLKSIGIKRLHINNDQLNNLNYLKEHNLIDNMDILSLTSANYLRANNQKSGIYKGLEFSKLKIYE